MKLFRRIVMKTIHSKDQQSFSQFSLGCMNLPLDNIKEVEAIIEFALAEGITYFDTADLYQFGENEKIVGDILSKYRSQYDFTIGTKVGNAFRETSREQIGWDPSAKHIKKSVKESLVRLKVSDIDLYQLHGGTIEDNKDETIQAFDELKAEGIIKSYGISSIRLNVIDYYLKNSSISTLMSQFNIIDNRPLETLDILPKDIVMLARGPLMQGLLTENYADALDKKHFRGVLGLSRDDISNKLSSLRDMYGNLTELSYQFLKYHNTVIVNGVSTLNQLEDNVNAFKNTKDLTPSEYQELQQHLKLLKYEEHRS